MKGRIFLLSLAQAVRAAVTALIPITLITLFGWASAGSDTGNTGDALRGSGLLWLGTHHALFNVHLPNSTAVAHFWFLPIGLLIVPYLTLRGAGLRIARELRGDLLENLVLAALALIFSYSVLATIVAALVRTKDLSPNPVSVFAFAALCALFFGAPRILEVNWAQEIRQIMSAARNALLILLSLGVVAVLVSLILNAGEVINIVSVLRLGLISGFFVFVTSVLYLPNLAVWAVAYFSGAGFGFGEGSLIAPWTTNIGAVPAFPVFAAIPAQAPAFARYLPLLIFCVFIAVGFRRFHVLEYLHVLLPALKVALVVAALAFVFAFLSGGPMIGGNLAAVGPSLWKFPLLLAFESFVGVALGALGRVLLDRLRPRQRLRRA